MGGFTNENMHSHTILTYISKNRSSSNNKNLLKEVETNILHAVWLEELETPSQRKFLPRDGMQSQSARERYRAHWFQRISLIASGYLKTGPNLRLLCLHVWLAGQVARSGRWGKGVKYISIVLWTWLYNFSELLSLGKSLYHSFIFKLYLWTNSFLCLDIWDI